MQYLRDSRTHRRVIFGAFSMAVACSILALILLFIYSEGMSKKLMEAIHGPHTRRSFSPDDDLN
jgi:hypothetical protein